MPKKHKTDSFDKKQISLTFPEIDLAKQLFGEHNRNLKIISEGVNAGIHSRGNVVFISGADVDVACAENILKQLYDLLAQGYPLYSNDVDYAVCTLCADHTAKLKDIFLDTVYVTSNKRIVTPKSRMQKKYIDAIRKFDMVFGIGPAGTGKTYLAMAMAASAFSKGLVKRIILTRPAVEAGETLGFLPGTLTEKIEPYLRPLYDALHDLMHFEKIAGFTKKGVIEVAPLAFMRGRTLNDAFIILDEAQNTTKEQMKMFLTRIGFNSKAVITGDITQTDLPPGKKSGLIESKKILYNIDGIKFIFFSESDVVRHKLVRSIIRAYDKAD